MSGILTLLAAIAAPAGAASLTNQTYRDDVASPTVAEVYVQLNSDGSLTFTGSTAPAEPSGEWNTLEPLSNAGQDWEVRVTVVGDALDVGNTGVWERLDVNRQYGYVVAAGSKSGVLTIELGPHGSNSAVESADFDLTATST